MKTISNSGWKQGLQKFPSNLNEIDTRSHTVLADIGTKTHALIDTHLNAASPHTGHSLTSHTHAGIYEPLLGFTPENASNKGASNGYAPLDTYQKVPTANLGTGTPDGTKFLRDDQTYVTPTASVNVKETEVDFGDENYITEQTFTIADADITASSQIIAQLSIKSPSDGRDVDEILWEDFIFACKAASGSFDLIMKSLNGSVNGKFLVNYING